MFNIQKSVSLKKAKLGLRVKVGIMKEQANVVGIPKIH
jgi:hypothetical protein